MRDFTVLIVGTEHPIHLGAWGAEPSSCEAFEQQLIEWCGNEDVDAIAEEMSDEAWERARAESTVLFDTTVPRRVAGSLGLAYRDCDNDHDIPEIAEVRRTAWFKGIDEREALKNRETMRECHWTKTLVSWRQSRVLFVCGYYHLSSLQEKLENRNIQTKILAGHWLPQSRSSGA